MDETEIAFTENELSILKFLNKKKELNQWELS